VEGGEERHRREIEREVREELLRRHQPELESSDALKAFLVRTKILLEARRVARRLSGRGWYLAA
jgi:hypothetical protein